MTSQVWRQTPRCVPYVINSDSDVFATPEAKAVVADSFAQWSQQTCTDFSFVDRGETTREDDFVERPASCNQNVIRSIDTMDELNAAITAGTFQDPLQVAITLTRFNATSGEIVDADIIINAASFKITTVTDEVSCRADAAKVHDLKNTLVHEIGHLIGFDHVLDADATMFAMAQQCELKKRDLSTDDVNAVCTVYPVGGPTTTCSPPTNGYNVPGVELFHDQCSRTGECESGGCSCGVSKTPGTPWSIAVLIVLVGTLRRRSYNRG